MCNIGIQTEAGIFNDAEIYVPAAANTINLSQVAAAYAKTSALIQYKVHPRAWQTNLLSKGSKKTAEQSVTISIPNHCIFIMLIKGLSTAPG